MRMKKKNFTFLVLMATFFSQVGESKNIFISPTKNDHEIIQEALILLEPGDSLTLKEGVYKFEDGLSLDVDKVTIKGEGKDKTILSFKKGVLTIKAKNAPWRNELSFLKEKIKKKLTKKLKLK